MDAWNSILVYIALLMRRIIDTVRGWFQFADDEPLQQINIHVEKLPVLITGLDKRSWWTRLKETVGQIIDRLLFCLAVGGSLILYGELELHGHGGALVIHIGTAFIVAAIVDFGYAWGSDARRLEKLTAIHLGTLQNLDSQLFSAAAEVQINNAMNHLSGGKSGDFGKQFGDLALAIGKLARGNGWASSAYMAFIAAFHGRLRTKTEQLASLGDAAETSVHVDMSDATFLADVLVEKTYTLLVDIPHSEYWAVSDLATWQDLKTYNEAHTKGVRELATKRLFVLGLASDRRLQPSIVNKIISDHWHLASVDGSKYKMKITTIADYRRSRLVELAEAQHFGIFKPPAERGDALTFLVRDEGLSNFRLIEAKGPMLAEYEQLWWDAEDLSKEDLSKEDLSKEDLTKEDLAKERRKVEIERINDFVMAYLIDRVAKNSRYRGVSNLAPWMAGKYERVFNASESAVDPKKNVKMRRILVLSEAECASSDAAKELRRHYQLRLKADTGYDFRVTAKVPEELMGELPFALLDGAEDDADQVVHELAQPEKDFAPASTAKRERIGAAFDELWESCKGCTKSLKAVLDKDRFSEVVSDAGKARRREFLRRALRMHRRERRPRKV